jgi:hypothetical protein
MKGDFLMATQQSLDEQAFHTQLEEKMSELMDLYEQNTMHAFTVTEEVKAFGLLLVAEYQDDGLIASMPRSEQILLVARVLLEVRIKHRKAHDYE